MIRRHRAAEPGLAKQRRQARVLHVPCGDQPLDHIGPVQAFQRHHIADGRQRHDIKQGEQIERGDALVTGFSQLAHGVDKNEEDDAGGAQMPLPRQVVLAVRIDQRHAWRQVRADLMVVDDNNIDAARFCSSKRFVAGRAAVDGHDQACTIVDQLVDRCWVGAVALENTVGNIDFRIDAKMAQEPEHQRR